MREQTWVDDSMRAIDYSNVIASVEKALVPSPELIDGRTEKDRLSFLTDFAALINFFDHNNRINGDWTPFLLKDPVILLASISRTKFNKYHTLYLGTCNKLQQTLAAKKEVGDIPNSFNQLFDQLTRIFRIIERWTYYLQLGTESYQLKKYIINQVKETYSQYFWALLSLRDFLTTTAILGTVAPSKYDLANSFTDLIWTENKGKNPYWEVLGISLEMQDLTASTFENEFETIVKSKGREDAVFELSEIVFNALKNAGDELFVFFNTIIQHSNSEYEKVKLLPDKYPDTTLIRAFVELMKIQQVQLNGISQKHLEFYYKDILLQKEQPAVADSVFISAVLSKTTSVFDLPAGTLFNAGTDAQKNPVVFESIEDVSLNAAAIASTYTLSQWPDGDNLIPLNFSNIPSPGILQTDANGNNLKWPTFGGYVTTQPAELAFAFASPMLLLNEGTRELRVTLNFSSAVDLRMLQTANCFLSTAKAWQKFPFTLTPAENQDSSSATIKINLEITDPAIETFIVNPDGLKADWPMLKIEFNYFFNLQQPPVISSMKIEVNVSGVKTFQVYNDNGLLSTKTPFQLFGPVPDVNSNFLIGNSEIFSKPLSLLIIELDWNALPSDFAVYYQAYNTYIDSSSFVWSQPAETSSSGAGVDSIMKLATSGTGTVPVSTKNSTDTADTSVEKKSHGIFSRFGNALKSFFAKIGGLFRSKQKANTTGTTNATTEEDTSTYVKFSNTCFTVNFFLLEDQSWNSFNVKLSQKVESPLSTVNSASEKIVPAAQSLFTTDDSGKLTDKSVFFYMDVETPSDKNLDPSIQNSPLTYTSASSSGFMKMNLNGPPYGFGASIYPGVIAYTTLQNAITLTSTTTKPSSDGKSSTTAPTSTTLLPNPNLPFAPKVSGLSAVYAASETYDFTSAAGAYPLQCFYYTPFAKYAAYDNNNNAGVGAIDFNSMAGSVTTMNNSLMLFPAFPFNGALFIELTNLVPSNTLNLFFELVRNYAGTTSTQIPAYFYLNKSGWENLPLLADGTNNLTCPGIIKFEIPQDIFNPTITMPGTNNWIAITETGDPALYAQTVLLTTNGIELKRSGNTFLNDTTAPEIAAAVISKPMIAIPQIATITQAFASFGGKAAENQMLMNQRVSNRIKTKNRAVTRNDFFRLIRQEFDDIYYSRAVYVPDMNVVNVYVVQQYDSATHANAFNPMVSECEENKIQALLENSSSLFSCISVSNFTFQYVVVTATIVPLTGYAWEGVKSNINQLLNIYLSPWITSSGKQLVIDKGISLPKLTEFLNGIDGVESVSGVSVSSYLLADHVKQPVSNPEGQDTILPVTGGLFVSSLDHKIQLSE
jgi:hypothetical protein